MGDILDKIGWNDAIHLLTYYDWIIENGLTIESLREELKEENENIRKRADDEYQKYIKVRREYRDKGLDDDWCESCDMPLLAIESRRPECESELRCPTCKYVKCLDISLADYNLSINNKLYPDQDIIIEPGSNRASERERKERRKICMSCKYLNGTSCKRCGCSMKHRTYYDILSCPDKRW